MQLLLWLRFPRKTKTVLWQRRPSLKVSNTSTSSPSSSSSTRALPLPIITTTTSTITMITITALIVQLIVLCFSDVATATNHVVQLSGHDFDAYTARYELVFLNFYADWCRFSQLLAPIFEEAAAKAALEFPDESKVLFAKVDCEQENALGTRFHISKYPTLKLMMNGKLHKREYRGQRSVDAMVAYVKELLRDPIESIGSLDDYHNKLDEKKPAIIAYVRSEEAKLRSTEYGLFRKVARDLKDDCHFYWITGSPALGVLNSSPPATTTDGQVVIRFKPSRSLPNNNDLQFPSTLKSYDELSTWATDKCIPLVREITFENAEELTEEGLPFVILFHHPDDKKSVELFTSVVNSELLSESSNVNFLLADGIKFAHPLHHLGKSAKDLPLVAIDSFRHMYMFPHFEDISIPGRLKEFIGDLYSGKLHREFHFGPEQPHVHDHGGGGGAGGDNQIQTQPPESTFAKLAPSRNRYTILKDEL